MRSLQLRKQVVQVGTIRDLTGIFESISSMRISRIKDRVVASQAFFDELWALYAQLRVDTKAPIGQRSAPKRAKPNVCLILTSQGALSGDIDDRIVRRLLDDYDAATTDLIVIGAHGLSLLAQRGITPQQSFVLPDTDEGVDVAPIIAALVGYENPSVYYQKYLSLTVQEPDRINLISRVQALAEGGESQNLITPRDYLFEPSAEEVVSYLESVMLEIALGQLILESRLAQHAARFSAMSAAHTKASELETATRLRFQRVKRLESDERLKEVITAMKLT